MQKEEITVKKIIIAVFVLAILLAGCTESNKPTKEKVQSQTSTVQEEETFGLNETAVFKNLKFTATELVESEGDGFFTPENGNIFIGVKFTIENISDEEQSVSSILLFDGYVDDVKCEYSLNASCAFSDGTIDGSIEPGKKLVGWYALEVPQNWSVIELNAKSEWLSNNSAKFVFNK